MKLKDIIIDNSVELADMEYHTAGMYKEYILGNLIVGDGLYKFIYDVQKAQITVPQGYEISTPNIWNIINEQLFYIRSRLVEI